MNERQRQEYLDAMGIIQFVPRRILSGAKASEPVVLPDLEADDFPSMQGDSHQVSPPQRQVVSDSLVSDETAVRSGSPAPKVDVNDVVQSLSREAGRTTAKGGNTDPAINDGVASESGKTLEPEVPARFALSVWRPCISLMILDSRQPGDALPTRALLQNILRAKAVELGATAPDILSWPPPGVSQPLGWFAARDMISAFLQARLDLQPTQYLWLMGESAYRAVLSATGSYKADLGKAVSVDELGALAVVLPSLADMLQRPELKACTWTAIRSLNVR